MLRMFARRMSHVLVSGNADQVLFGVSLPSESLVHDVRVKVKMVGTSKTREQFNCLMYGVEGWILPVHDPDSGSTYEALWDSLVPKDSAVETLDLDTGAADVTPFYEPGEVDLSDLFDVGLRPERLYHRHKMLTIGNGAVFMYQDNQTPFNLLWVAGDEFVIQIRRRLAVRKPSVLVFAMASPNLNATTAVVDAILGEAEWGQVKYMSHILERAMLHVLGVVESGAETPWEEATALLVKQLDPDLYEETAGRFQSENFDVFTEAMVDMSVVGDIGKVAVSTGR